MDMEAPLGSTGSPISSAAFKHDRCTGVTTRESPGERPTPASASKVLPPGTFNVGMCVRNNGSSTINNNNYVNGWVMVTS
jgi:hypothetical protein